MLWPKPSGSISIGDDTVPFLPDKVKLTSVMCGMSACPLKVDHLINDAFSLFQVRHTYLVSTKTYGLLLLPLYFNNSHTLSYPIAIKRKRLSENSRRACIHEHCPPTFLLRNVMSLYWALYHTFCAPSFWKTIRRPCIQKRILSMLWNITCRWTDLVILIIQM